MREVKRRFSLNEQELAEQQKNGIASSTLILTHINLSTAS